MNVCPSRRYPILPRVVVPRSCTNLWQLYHWQNCFSLVPHPRPDREPSTFIFSFKLAIEKRAYLVGMIQRISSRLKEF